MPSPSPSTTLTGRPSSRIVRSSSVVFPARRAHQVTETIPRSQPTPVVGRELVVAGKDPLLQVDGVGAQLVVAMTVAHDRGHDRGRGRGVLLVVRMVMPSRRGSGRGRPPTPSIRTSSVPQPQVAHMA